LYEKPKRSKKTVDSSVKVALIGCLSPVLVALIALLGSIIVKATDDKGTQQPVIIVILELIRDRSGGNKIVYVTNQPSITTFPETTLIPPSRVLLISSVTKAQLDSLVGDGNWFCFPHTGQQVGINIMTQFTVKSPIKTIEYWDKIYNQGELVKSFGGATANLIGTLDQSECPSWQQGALQKWLEQPDTLKVNKQYMDNLLGSTHWTCNFSGDRVDFVKIQGGIDKLLLQYPFSSLDSQDHKYGIGQSVTIPEGVLGTLWIVGVYPKSECQN